MPEFNAWSLAKAWNSVALAQSTDRDRPTLYRTTLIEQYPEGIRLIATDSFVLLKAWVPDVDNRGAVEPAQDVEPEESMVCMDRDRRIQGLMSYAMKQTADDGQETRHTMSMVLGTVRPESQIQLSGMAQASVSFHFGSEYDERIESPIFDGAFPPWKGLWYAHEPAETAMVTFGANGFLRIGKLSALWDKASIRFVLGGIFGVCKFYVDAPDVNVEGLAMPIAPADAVPPSAEGIHSTFGEQLEQWLESVAATEEPSGEPHNLDPDSDAGDDSDPTVRYRRAQLLKAARLAIDYQYADEDLLTHQLDVTAQRANELLEALLAAGVLEALDAAGKLATTAGAAEIVARMEGDDGQTPEPVQP